MSTYAIYNQLSNRFLCGTDKTKSPWYQITSTESAILYPTLVDAYADLKSRKCNKRYRVVEVTMPQPLHYVSLDSEITALVKEPEVDKAALEADFKKLKKKAAKCKKASKKAAKKASKKYKELQKQSA